MKILFYGDSITDAGRRRDEIGSIGSFGYGYPIQIAGRLAEEDPTKYQCVNTGIGGNRVVDLYSRIKIDCWNHAPDLISILIGINDIWHEVDMKNGVELDRFEKVYRMIIEDTKKVLPNVKLLLMEPFVLPGGATHATEERYEQFCGVKNYAKVVKKLADEYGLYFLPLQKKLEEAGKKYGNESILGDGVHPALGGTALIAKEWLKLFREKIEPDMQ